MAERTEAERATVFLVDDHPVLARGLATLLADAGFLVTGVATGVASALEALQAAPADLAVVDLSLDDGRGHDLIAALRERCPTTGVVVYSVDEDAGPIRRSLDAGARGYVTKRERPELLVGCLHAVRAGGTFLSPVAARARGGPQPRTASPGAGASKPLSATEREVYRMVGEGCPTPEIAERLGIARGTVETYYDRILDKLGLTSRRELRRHAIAAAQKRG
jgi:DNA-binding NarL/FixJ family response regulator